MGRFARFEDEIFRLTVLIFAATAVGPMSAADSAAGRAWQEFAPHRVAPLAVPAAGKTGFTLLPPELTGARFTNQLADSLLARNQILEVGSGVALGDVDGDDRVDIYLCALQGGNRLYRNLGGWRFEDITAPANVGCAGQFSTGAVLADVDGDSDLDLLVNSIGGGTRLFVNHGAARFREVTEAGLGTHNGSTSLALADVDGDGFLDLYVANYRTQTVKDRPGDMDVRAGYVGGKFVVTRPDLFSPIFTKSGGVSLFERGEPDALYFNDGRGNFKAVSWTNGTFLDAAGQPLAEEPRDWGLSVAFRDLNGDGQPDLYVCNDFFHSPDRVWLNDGRGRFRPLPAPAMRQQSMSSMAVDFADLNRDGFDDVFVVDMMSRDHRRRQRQRGSLIHVQASVPIGDPNFRPELPRNTLFVGRGDGTFAEVAQAAGLDASEWSWSVAFLDVDLDGFEDVLVTTGNLRDANDGDVAKQRAQRMEPGARSRSRPPFPKLEAAKVAFRNRGDLTFEETGRAWGFDTAGIAHGLGLGDLDNDGDLDVVVNEMHRPVGLYRNDSTAPRLAVRLHGQAPNTKGIGAKIVVHGGAVPHQSQEVMSGGRYLSGDNAERTFAAGAMTNRMRIEVTWRNGARSVIDGALANHAYEVKEPAPGTSAPPPRQARSPAPVFGHEIRTPCFENLSSTLKRGHQDAEFDDFERQPLLPRRLSQLGPGVTWFDLDGDGWEDLLVGGAAKEHQVLYLNNRQGQFGAMRRSAPPERDQTALLAVRSSGAEVRLLTGSSNYEDGREAGAGVLQYDPLRNTEDAVSHATNSSVGPLALGVVGGQFALFVGGRVRAGRYPEAAVSRLYLGDGKKWTLDTNAGAAFIGLGLATGATWTDWDGDGVLELVVASEWGPIHVYAFRAGRWTEITGDLGLDSYLGWWNGVATGDFDGDGRLDLLAANWGRNTKYQRHRDHPLRLYYGDWLGLGRVDMLEAYYEPSLGKYVPFVPLDHLRQACPPLAEPFATFAAYATAGIDDILGAGLRGGQFLEASWFDTTLFLNRGTGVEARSLPSEAQWAPAFGVAIGDIDGDGNEDAFLSQNFFGVDSESSRLDAGRGLWLRGDGRGGLTPVPSQQSGVELYGEQRGCALCDYDQDGRVDLVVGQNRGGIGLFRNVGGQPGLRVRLRGPAWNPDALGATVRLRHGAGLGPARLVRAGSGYWSQDSLVQVFSRAGNPTAVQVRWPGGKISEQTITATNREILVPSP